MKALSVLLLLFSFSNVFCQQPNNQNKEVKVAFKNKLDSFSLQSNMRRVKRELGEPDSTSFRWINFSFGGPRVFQWISGMKYEKLNAWFSFVKTTGRRKGPPSSQNAPLTSVSVESGYLYFDKNPIEIGITLRQQIEHLLLHSDYNLTEYNEIEILSDHKKLVLSFDESNQLENVLVSFNNNP